MPVADTMSRVARLIAAGAAGAIGIDFEFADYCRSANIRQKIHLATTRSPTTELILSSHDFNWKTRQPGGHC